MISRLALAVALPLLLCLPAHAAADHAHADGAAVHDDHDHDHDHDDHVTAAGDLKIVHAWARAARAGQATNVFFELDNAGETDTLEGASADFAASVAIVGFSLAEGNAVYGELGPVPVAPGAFAFDPFGISLRLDGLTRDLEQGDHVHVLLTFAGAGEVEIHVDVEAANANQHSHAGHSH